MKSSTGTQGQQPNAGKPKTAPRPRVVKLEGRIAPRIALNHNETLDRELEQAKLEAAKPKKQSPPRTKLRVVKLEERVVPRSGGGGCDEFGCGMNHNETLAREPAKARPDASKPKKASRLKLVKLEGRIAPGIWQNHNETLVSEPAEAKPETPTARPDADKPKLRVVKLEERIAPKLAANHNETLVRDRA